LSVNLSHRPAHWVGPTGGFHTGYASLAGTAATDIATTTRFAIAAASSSECCYTGQFLHLL